MKLKYIFEYVDLGEEIIAVPICADANDFRGIIKLNTAGKEMFKLLEQDTSEKQIIDILSSRYENDLESLSKYVSNYIEKLRVNNLIEE